MADTGSSARNPGFRLEVALLAGAIVLFLVALLTVLFSQAAIQRRDVWLQQTLQMRNDVASLGSLGRDAGSGGVPQFEVFDQRLRSIATQLNGLADGNAALGSAALPSRVQNDLETVSTSWQEMRAGVEEVLGQRESYVASTNALTSLETIVFDVLQRYEQVAERLANRGAPAGQLYLVAGQMIRLERLRGLTQASISGATMIEDAARQLELEAQTFVGNNDALLGSSGNFVAVRDPQADQLLGSINADFAPALAAIATVRSASPNLTSLQESAASLDSQSVQVIDSIEALEARIIGVTSGSLTQMVLVYGSGALAIVLLCLFLYWSIHNAQLRARAADERDSRQQGAILNLLDEITNLADGDLTVDVTVTEDFTGAIADSINYTVDTLRRLVGTINDTSVEIAAAANSTQDTAQKMNQASERQAREIGNATNMITQTAQSLTQVATRAEEISQDAANSVQVAHNGAATVGRTIQGMSSLREQIQETAKRIKRLGESSQEIGNIIEFINDIAEQTNTLALNASIQAAMAGEAGRGFAVVADEVQRLAERAGSATRQIETLVKTIQADTTEAIISMERSTANVVSGARNAEEAGQALTKIETTSTEVARLIQDIATSARTQSAQATKIAGQMQTIRDIAVQTSGSAGQTARAVGELSTLSEKLRESVAGFKLPSEESANSDMAFASAA